MSAIEVTTVGFGDGIEIPDVEGLKEWLIEELALRIQARTPVDTGNARDGWNIDGDAIVNFVEYIQYLEYGHSQQAPNGMVRVTLAEVPMLIEKYLAQNRKKKR
jgi:hypothetical protein